MGLYESWILPRLIDLGMRNRVVRPYRARVVPQARAQVLEVGIGSGLNLPYYDARVQCIVGLDPSSALLALTRRRVQAQAHSVQLLQGSAEAIPLADRSVDAVVTTFTLCSVRDPAAALSEMRRVLRPKGVLLFAEHGLAPEPSVQRWQRRLTPAWCRIAGGCHLDRKTDALIAQAGFAIVELVAEYAPGPRLMTYIYSGMARREP